jgi:hypothetical protein
MNAPEFPVPAERVVATLAELFRLQQKPDLADLLASSDMALEATGSDFGVDFYTLSLEVDLPVFAKVEPRLRDIEKTIQNKINTTIRYPSDSITEVVVRPALLNAMAITRARAVGDDQAMRLWGPQPARVFLSHVAAHKIAVAGLKRSLGTFGLSAFVAHEDIEPTLDWRDEIDLALRSMHIMVALLTPDFHQSYWTDQEIGAAFARGLPVVPVRLGSDPYGFLGRYQALPGDLAKPDELASSIVEVLEKKPSVSDLMREALVQGLESANSFANAKLVTSRIERTEGFSEEQLARMQAAITANDQVLSAIRVPERLRRYVEAHSIFSSA